MSDPTSPPGEPGPLRRVGAATAATARTAGPDVASGAATFWSFMQANVLPGVKRFGNRVGNWLATVGWVKYALVAVLLLIFARLVSEVLYGGGGPAIVVESPRAGKERVQVDIKVGAEGIRIERPGATVAASAPVTPEQGGTVTVDDTGVRITTKKDGAPVQVIIGNDGVRVEKGAPIPPVPPAAPTPPQPPQPPEVIIDRGGAVVIPPEVVADPAKVNKAIETARQEIESIISDQVDRSIAREVHTYRERSGDWLLTFAFLLILTGIIVKVVLGGKQRAERRAQAATATAAEEGLKRQLVEAQLKMMQAQVEPHFLFNTLASVDYLIETDPTTASKMQKNLIQYLRAALPQMREGSTTLGKEVQLCRAYLEILKFRMEDRLQYAVTVPQGLMSAQFPPMMLQSLVENCIKHGLEPKPEGGAVTISADIVDGRLRVTVADTGLGFAAASRPGTGVGLANVRERLAALYGSRARLSIEANSPSGTIVIIDVPYTFEADAPLRTDAQAA
jgi:hypothetical protein